MVELERPLKLADGDNVKMTVIIDGNKGVAYLNDVIAMNFRAYDLPAGNWGFFTCDGESSFSNIAMKTL